MFTEVKVSSTSNTLVVHTSLPPLCLHCGAFFELLPWLYKSCLSCMNDSIIDITCGVALLTPSMFGACCLSCASLMMFMASAQWCMRDCLLFTTLCFCPRRSGDAPMQCDLSLLVTLQAALFHTKASSRRAFRITSQQPQNTTQASRSRACLPCAWTLDCLPLPAWTLRIRLDTHSKGFLLC